jgi:hypothetical protein
MTPDKLLHWPHDGLCQAKAPDSRDEYLDDLVPVQAAGYLDEYLARFLEKKQWKLPDDPGTRTLVAFDA